MADYDPDSTASNYSIQPGKSVDYPSQGKPMDPSDHPAHNMPTATEHYDGAQLGDMVMRGRSILDKDRADSTRAAFQGGGYDSTGTFKGGN